MKVHVIERGQDVYFKVRVGALTLRAIVAAN